jgi:hypothetical protein
MYVLRIEPTGHDEVQLLSHILAHDSFQLHYTVHTINLLQATIECVSEEGEECRQISDAPTMDDCLLDVTYTYTVENIGIADFNILIFNRTRNNETMNLVPLLDDTFLAIGDTTAVQETEEIDRCVAQSFSTKIDVKMVPTAESICQNVDTYP